MSDDTISVEQKTRVAGILAQYDSPADCFHAAEKVRDAGYSKWDVHSPFPVHGMDGAMGLKPTPMGWISLAGGLTGGSLALLMQWWMNGYDYPLNIGGKPAFAVQAFVPITFELTILLTTFATLFGMLGLNRLPQLYHWAFSGKTFGRATDDLFFISIDAEDPKFDREGTRKLLDKTHPSLVEEIEETFEVTSEDLKKNVGLTVEAIAGISSPFKEKEHAGKDLGNATVEDVAADPVISPAKSTPPAAKAKSEPPSVEAKAEEKAKSEPPPPEAETKSKAPTVEGNAEEKTKSEPPPAETKAESTDETKSEKQDGEKKDEGEAPKGGTEK